MKTILTKKGESILVDDDVYLWASQFNWRVVIERGYKYVLCGDTLLHRAVMGVHKENDVVVDHINHNTLDNRKCNLRVCTSQENLLNQVVRRNNTTGYKGVNRNKDTGMYDARISHRGNKYFLGSFDNPKDAALAYNEKCKELHGWFANLNIV